MLLLFLVQINLYSYSQVKLVDSLELVNLTDSAFNMHRYNFKNAKELCNVAIEKSKESGSVYLFKNALFTSAYLDWFNGDHLSALEKSQESLVLSINLQDTIRVAENYMLKGLVYLYTSDYDSSLINFNRALFYFSALKDTASVLRNYGFVGLVYNNQGNYLKAKENLMRQVLLKRQFDTPEWNVIRFDENETNRKYFDESLINAKQNLNNYLGEAKPSMDKRFAFRNVGLIYRELGDIDSSLYYLKKSADVATLLKSDVIWFDLAKGYNTKGLFDSAFWAVEKGIAEAKDHGTRIVLSYSYSTKGHIYIATNQIEKAIVEYKKALELEKLMLHKSAQMKLMLNIAKQEIAINHFLKALSYADSSLLIAQKIDARNSILSALDVQFQTLEKLGNYKKALEAKKKYNVLLDSLQKGKVQLELAKLDLYNDVELSKLKISELNKQHELSKAHLKNRTLLMVLVLIVAVFIILLLLLNYYRTEKLKKLNVELNSQQKIIGSQNKELTKSNKEKEILLGEIHHRVKNNLQTISSLLSIQQRKLKDPDTIKVLEDSKNRVMAMGLIHQHLYQNTSFSEIDFKNYIKELVRVMIRTNACSEIEVKSSIPPLVIDLDNAIFFGLIINELVINSIKHAYEGVKSPLLEISIYELDNDTILEVKDNGQKKDIDLEDKNSFGWKMINTICSKLDGRVEVNSLGGLSVKLFFSKEVIALK